MTGLICGIKRMEIHDGDGLRTTVFFKGCPLRCLWCHNPESLSFEPQIAKFGQKCIGCGECKGQKSEKAAANCPTEALVTYGTEYSVDDLVTVLIKDKPFFDRSGGGVTLSGGECLAQPDFAVELARRLKENGISVYVDTCGYVKQEILDKIIPYTDVFLYDIKAVDPQVHAACTGKENHIILENLSFLSKKGCTIDIRYPLVMGYNDSECEKIAEFLKDIKGIRQIKVLQYHSFSKSRYEALGMSFPISDVVTSKADVKNAVNVFRKAQLNAISSISEN